MGEIIIRYLNVPGKVNAVTVVDEEGDYNIYINPALSHEEQKKACDHELAHIKKNHFYNKKISVSQCETEAEDY